MAAIVSPIVLAPALFLLAAFLAGWHHQFGSLPPLRATAVVALAAVIVVYSMASASELLERPVESAIVLAGVLVLLAAFRHVRRRIEG